MREILFRGKRRDNGEWVYGVAVNRCGSEITLIITSCECVMDIECEVVDSETVGQYIEINTIKNERIFDGDVFIKNTDDVFYVKVYSMTNIKCKSISGYLKERGMDEVPCTVHSFLNARRIGNIHDNQELLEAKKELKG